jgi:predicted ATPase
MARLKQFILVSIGAFVFTFGSAIASEKQFGGGPWTDPDVIKAAIAIDMTAEQSAAFRSSVGAFIDGVMRQSMTLIKHQKPDLKRELKRVYRKHGKRMDKNMQTVFTEEAQYARYEAYRDLLLSKMKKMGSGRRR